MTNILITIFSTTSFFNVSIPSGLKTTSSRSGAYASLIHRSKEKEKFEPDLAGVK